MKPEDFNTQNALPVNYGPLPTIEAARATRERRTYLIKRAIDYTAVFLALPLVALVALLLLVLNPIWNPGRLFFVQERMGKNREVFGMWKFRTMTEGEAVRAADAPLDTHRITPLGRVLRATHIDELPNIFNILSGEMSLVGPRPDARTHAESYIRDVPHYRHRFAVRPGITGLAQVCGGYADCARSVARKARYDRYYVERHSLALEAFVIVATFAVILRGFGR